MPQVSQKDANVLNVNVGGFGHSFYVNEGTGKDTNDGSRFLPFASLAKALTKCTANNNDVIYLIGTVHVAGGALAWNVDGVSLVGLTSPSAGDRAVITHSGTVFTPMVDVTAQGCSFKNINALAGFNSNTAQVCWKEEGGGNYYENCQFLGMNHATAGGHVGGRSLLVTGPTGDNVFRGCVIGNDAVIRSAANASMEFTASTPRNEFIDCKFRMNTSAATALHITAGATSIISYALFRGCMFVNDVDLAVGSTVLTAGIIANAAAGGSLLLDSDCLSVGATAIATTGPVYGAASAIGAATTGIAIKLT